MLTTLRQLIADEDGATLVEYALVLTVLALAVLAGVNSVGGVMKNSFNNISSSVGNA